MQPNAYPALVLNADFQPLNYFPLSTMPWQTSVKAVIEETVAVLESYPADCRSSSLSIPIPSVVALKKYQPPPKRVPFTRFNVFLRDLFTCQYCGQQHDAHELTFDHVVPRAKGGITVWENIVAACEPCNGRKDKHNAMRPLRMPFKPEPRQLMAAKRKFPPNHLHESWMDYLFWDSELEQ
jgi:5-methylcytosine-specific restriction endonuclease McrA